MIILIISHRVEKRWREIKRETQRKEEKYWSWIALTENVINQSNPYFFLSFKWWINERAMQFNRLNFSLLFKQWISHYVNLLHLYFIQCFQTWLCMFNVQCNVKWMQMWQSEITLNSIAESNTKRMDPGAWSNLVKGSDF